MDSHANSPATATGSAPHEHGTAADGPRPSVAVIGAGVSGLTAAYLLSRTHDVILFEAEERLGGHARTHDVTDSNGRQHAVDSGFIVHNDVTYPWLRRLFGELDVQVRPAEMSMSVRCEGCGLQYAGGRGLRGVFAQPRRLIDPRFVRMLWQVTRFRRRASAFLRATDDENLTTYGEFLEREGFSGYFIAHYAVPVISCVWSAGRETTLAYPARYLFRFLDQHGMLRAGGSPQWYSVAGGSRVYVERLARLLKDVRAAHAVTDVTRREDGVQIRDVTGQVTRVDRVVIATHADQALGLLADPGDAEVSTLKQFGYSRNLTVLHTDSSVLPDAAQARASWNYRMTSCHRPGQPAVVTYWMNRLQGHRAAQDFLVTLNDRECLDPESIVAAMDYEHPIYTPEAVRAQSQLGDLATDSTVYAGAYHGWGFHEDGCRSGVEAARHFGLAW
ncbi:MAG TPA: FAD-dependent oxidoreductase [Streptosporangiaceae bacterium]|jgi:predicted NAD/FAD-binding protein|nr:FAD-dependent oxidoreductase [Streptosporangiaceae bacterium]